MVNTYTTEAVLSDADIRRVWEGEKGKGTTLGRLCERALEGDAAARYACEQMLAGGRAAAGGRVRA